MSKAWQLLRSRKLAVWTIAIFSAYAAASTVFSADRTTPYRSPLFLAIAALLTVSTGVCAWDRTRSALSSARMRPASEAALARVRETPSIVIAVGARGNVLESAGHALKALGMRVLRTGDSIEARGGMMGALGSSLFHWSLALLFVVIALGQLTRAEGVMGVVAGSSKPDTAGSYGVLEAGPLAGPLTGRVIAVPSIEANFTANGVEQGVTPFVEIRSADGSTILASGRAYPNHPVRYRSMLVHLDDDGLAAVVEVTSAEGSSRQEVLLDYNEDRTAVEPAVFVIEGPASEALATVRLAPAEPGPAGTPRVRVQAAPGESPPGAAMAVDEVIDEGAEVGLPAGLGLRVVQLTKYARLSVVNDWSVYWIYSLFVFGVVGLTLAIFVPLRRTRVVLVGDDGHARLHVAVHHSRGDPYFAARVEAALRARFDRGEEAE